MDSFIQILQVISAIFLVLLILAQNRGEGLTGSAFGGSGGGGGGVHGTKRGAEKILANATVVTMVLFVVLSFAASVV
jgi:protein translocase SecG subunit